ncbi:uncharacterized protein BYT42DRAFT_79185 [Radiomyces spectabilis]|uniref:uncharacterized protein n=1 Tax=Radiomyces spectabilis TaxID=64574 RepID=UPI0022200077|nr:uncharacterized protein BYT42DRAFT_79185 [Radiomyces spectabilis]KAI8371720.1 hypothetical protein BYT42DRAFT_79185 [Radiomyces spectabilis]
MVAAQTLKRALVATDIRSHASRGRSPSRGLVLPTDLCDLARIRQPLPLTKKAKREYLAMIYKKKRCLVKARKPYQVLMRTRTALGVPFLRVRGFRQPLQVSMMLKDRVKTNQKQVYRCQELVEQIAMMEQEDKFLKQLKVPSDAEEFASPLRQILQDYASKYALRNEQLDFINQQRTKNRVIK